MRLEIRKGFILDDPDDDAILFDDRAELGAVLALLSFEIARLPAGLLHLYQDGTLYDENLDMIWDAEPRRFTTDFWEDIWEQADQATSRQQ